MHPDCQILQSNGIYGVPFDFILILSKITVLFVMLYAGKGTAYYPWIREGKMAKIE